MADFELVGHEIETPLVNAAGSINGTSSELILREVETLANTAIGAITVGSFTVPEQAGNEVKYGSPTYYHDKRTGATYNSRGLPNIGLPAAKVLMPEIITRAHEKGKPVIASVSSTLHTDEIGNSLQQLKRLVYEMLLTGVELVEINTSSPNTVTAEGGRKPIIGYDLETMEELVSELAPYTGTLNSKTGVKLPPFIKAEEKQTALALANLFNNNRVFGFVVTANTIGGQIPRDEAGNHILSVPGGAGGMSGPATREVGREQLRMWKGLLGDDIEIISTLGVDSGKELAVRRQLGATAAGGVTFLWESKDWATAVTELVCDWIAAQEQ